MICKVCNYCKDKDEYNDILRICEPLLNQIAAGNKYDVEAGQERVSEFGCVYLMKSGRFYKIGRSDHPGRREYDLALQMPEKPNKIHEIRTDDPKGIEAYWHNRFASKRKGGEWFDLDAADIQAFKRRKFM
jgi:hypothetical protein